MQHLPTMSGGVFPSGPTINANSSERHTYLVPPPPSTAKEIVLSDIEKNCEVICGPKVCTGKCGRQSDSTSQSQSTPRWRMLEGLSPETPDAFTPHILSDFDICHGNSLTGCIQIMLRITICISVACCLARADFNLPILMYAYYEWAICGDWHREAKIYRVQNNLPVSQVYERTSGLLVATPETMRGVGLASFLLTIANVANIVWLLLAGASWTCAFSPDENCLSGGLLQTRRIHAFVLALSFVNLLLIMALMVSSWAWLRVQQKYYKFLESISI